MNYKDFQKAIDERDAEIRRLEEQKRQLRAKLKEAQEAPDLHLFLSECIKRQKETNAVLKEILANSKALNPDKVKELLGLIKKAVEIIKASAPEKEERRMLAGE